MPKFQQNLVFIFFFIFLFDSINATVLVKAGNEINFSCDRNIYYILIDVVFSQKPPKEHYPFTLSLTSPKQLNFKCMLDYQKKKDILLSFIF